MAIKIKSEGLREFLNSLKSEPVTDERVNEFARTLEDFMGPVIEEVAKAKIRDEVRNEFNLEFAHDLRYLVNRLQEFEKKYAPDDKFESQVKHTCERTTGECGCHHNPIV